MMDREARSVGVIDVRDDIDRREMMRIRRSVVGLADRGQVNVVLSVKGADSISLFAIGDLIGLRNTLRNLDGDLKVAGASDFITQIFRRAGAGSWIESYASVEDAMLSFDSDWAGMEGAVH